MEGVEWPKEMVGQNWVSRWTRHPSAASTFRAGERMILLPPPNLATAMVSSGPTHYLPAYLSTYLP